MIFPELMSFAGVTAYGIMALAFLLWSVVFYQWGKKDGHVEGFSRGYNKGNYEGREQEKKDIWTLIGNCIRMKTAFRVTYSSKLGYNNEFDKEYIVLEKPEEKPEEPQQHVEMKSEDFQRPASVKKVARKGRR